MQTLARVQRVPGLAAPRHSEPMTRRRSHRLHSPIATKRGASLASSWGLAPASVPPRASCVATRALPTDRLASLWGEECLADLTLLICLRGGGDDVSSSELHTRLPVHRLMLEAHGALDAILGASTPAVEEGGKLPAVQLTVADEEEASTAEAVLRLMYAGDLPAGLSVQQLGRMHAVASRWGAEQIVTLCKGACYGLRQQEERVAAAASSALASKLFQDVHLLLTTPARLQLFLALPFEGVLAWAGSDGLVVDSENSVVVALDCWVRLGRGKGCSKEQLLQLSSLVRAKHLTPSFLDSTGALPWWHHSKEEMQCFAVGETEDGGARSFPSAWLAPPRQQLPRDVLQQRTTITWAVPREELGDGSFIMLSSPPIYCAGSSAELGLYLPHSGMHSQSPLDHDPKQQPAVVYLCARRYFSGQDQELLVVPRDRPTTLNAYTITRTMPDGSEVTVVASSDRRVVEKRCTRVAPPFPLDMSQLDRELVRGHLVLRAMLDLEV